MSYQRQALCEKCLVTNVPVTENLTFKYSKPDILVIFFICFIISQTFKIASLLNAHYDYRLFFYEKMFSQNIDKSTSSSHSILAKIDPYVSKLQSSLICIYTQLVLCHITCVEGKKIMFGIMLPNFFFECYS